MEILQAKEDFGPVKKGDKVIVLPEYKALLTTIICLPPFFIPKQIVVELIAVVLNEDNNRDEQTNSSFQSSPRKFIHREVTGDDNYIYHVDARLLEREGASKSA
jgi:hypothetical protein